MSHLNSDKEWDVIILGAGPAGSSLASAVAKKGWDTLLLDRCRFPHHKVCGEFLSPEAQETLHRLDLYPAVKALSPCPINQVCLVSARGITAQAPLPGSAWGISRYKLDTALVAAAEQNGVEVRTGLTATAVQPVKEKFSVELRQKTGAATLRARAVIAACGRYTRPGLPPASSSNSGQLCVGLKCHYRNVLMPAQVELYFFPGGYAGVNPVEGGQVNVGLLVTQTAFDRTGKRVQSIIEKISCDWNPALGKRLSAGIALPETEAAVAPVYLDRPATPWDGIACVGDTAVMIPPLCGDGMAMALRSAELCGEPAHRFLTGELSLSGWQSAYQQAWHTEFDQPLRIGRYLQKASNLPLLLNGVIRFGHFFPWVVKQMVKATRPLPAQPHPPKI